MDEKILETEIERLLNDAENYLTYAKSKGKEMRNFEAMLALEFAIKAKDKSKKLRHKEEFFEHVNRRIDIILDEVKKLPAPLRRKSPEETKYEEGDVAGG